MLKVNPSLQGKIVVITGASSGIGRAAALEFARQGARVVLAARRQSDLEEAARLCRDAGGEAISQVTDVTVEQQVQALVQSTLERWGRIDVWVNNAGVTLFGLLEDGSFGDHRRVIETNLLGAMLAARAVVPVFKAQRAGVMINIGSILSKVGQAFVPSYVISKFGLRGMSEALRVELAEYPDIHVCTLLPYAVDTPHFQSGGNEVGLRARAMPPTQSPEKVARAIVRLSKRPRRELHVPKIAVVGYGVRALFPRTSERLLLRALGRWHFAPQTQAETTGNLYRPVEQGAGEMHGERGPQVGTVGFLLWVARELIQLPAAELRRRSRRERDAPHLDASRP